MISEGNHEDPERQMGDQETTSGSEEQNGSGSEDDDDDESLEKELIDDSDFEDMSDEEAQVGCVKVVNDVEFNFDDGMENEGAYVRAWQSLRAGFFEHFFGPF